MRCVYKKNCPTVFTNYRGVVPTSHLGKLFERVLLCRLLGIAESDELQAVANPGIDTRSQIHLVYDLRLISDIWVLTIDITRGFPSTSRDLAVAALRDAGIGGRLLRAIIGLIFGTSVTIGVRRGVDTNRVPLGVGLLEGAVLSPALFAFVTNSLIAALRASGLGARIDGVHVPAVMLMDDLAILARSEREMKAMARVVFEWSYRNRYVLALVDKSHICRGVPRTAADDAARLKTRLTYVPVWKPKYYESKPRIFVPRQIEVQRKVEVGGGG